MTSSAFTALIFVTEAGCTISPDRGIRARSYPGSLSCKGATRMGHKRLRFLGVVAAAMVFTLACGGTTGGGTPTKTYKIGLVTDIGGLNDKSFNHLADVGLEKAKTDFKNQADVKESKSGDDYVPNLTDFATKNYDLVIGVGFLMQEAVGTVSGQFPNIHFAIIDGAGTDSKGADLKDADPSVIASALKKVDVATYTAIKNVVNNQFQAGALTFEIKNGGAGYSVDNLDLPAELKAELDKIEGQIKSGALTPPADIPA